VNKDFATHLLNNLLERASSSTEKTFLTSREIEALAILLDAINPNAKPINETKSSSTTKPIAFTLKFAPVSPDDIAKDFLLCVDFGTSFSKAFATLEKGLVRPELIDLPIGDGSTGSALTSPSELFIDNGRLYFGLHARKQLEDTQASPDRLIDSIKQFITLNSDVTLLEKSKLNVVQDPTQTFSRRDILALYLGHLMKLTETSLAAKGLPINICRRFTHPAWKDGSKEKNENEMRVMMAEAIVLARSTEISLSESISTVDARNLLDQLGQFDRNRLPLDLIREPVREATAAGAGAILATPEHNREIFLIVDIGAGTTDVAGFICVNNPDWERARLFEIVGAANAKNMAGNVLDTALQKLVMEKSALVPDSEEYRAAAMAVRRDRRLFKEQLFASGEVIVPLPTDENVRVTLEEFQAYPPVVTFENQITEMISNSAGIAAGDFNRINLVATGGGARLPLVKVLSEQGVTYEGRQILLNSREALADGVRQTNPELVDLYPQIAVALGGALPTLPEQMTGQQRGLTSAPARHMGPMYKS
jgi:hypothetical protein